MKPHFSNLHTNSLLVEDNELFSLYTNSNFPYLKEANFLQLKFSPLLEEFQLIEDITITHQLEQDQDFLSFKWPENIGIHLEVLDYLNKNNYKIGQQALMRLEPKRFKTSRSNSTVNIQTVSLENLESFLRINEKEDMQFGEIFSKMKQEVYEHLFKQNNLFFIQATLGNKPVGTAIIILSDAFIEVDHLLTDQAYRNKGVGSAMIQYTRDLALRENKTILLAADAEDAPKVMYEKMGFETIALQISAQLDSFSSF